MGLTFQQSFYRVPEKVFLVMCHNGHPEAILEIPEDPEDALELKKKFTSDIYKVVTLDIDELIINGYNLQKQQ